MARTKPSYCEKATRPCPASSEPGATTTSSTHPISSPKPASAKKPSELKLHYQPIFHSAPGGAVVIAGLEALLRWIDATGNTIPPSHFIPLAEETGLIVQVGKFVLHQACKQATDWRHRGLLPGRIAVNVSSLELAREDFAETVLLTLRQHYTPPDAIELEVTESALVNDFALAERHLRELHACGLRISIDDFGTGYSSLGRLRQLTLDTLKIDRLFIEGVATSEEDRAVVEHIIAMAHTLHMTVVAEGVENHAQLDVLRSLGCDEIQGFLLAKPQSKDLTEKMLLQRLHREDTSSSTFDSVAHT
jgi:EAL domain-containing protein (putative c-di-GMP-specific phosphodiesterase class I)